MSEAEVAGDDIVNDALGELTNMVAGHFKARLKNTGQECLLTIPSVVRGHDFKVASVAGAHRCSVAFQCEASEVRLEVIIKSKVNPES
jgi:chemotaxis protein CheX